MTTDLALPNDVDRFIGRHIHSVEQLEVLLLLRRTAPEAWSTTAVARELRIDAKSAELRLVDLADRSLLVMTGGGTRYVYAPSDRRDADAIEKLSRAYAERRVSVIARIFSKADAGRSLAEALRSKVGK